MVHHKGEENARRSPLFQRVEQAMMTSINEAIDKAAADARNEIPDVAERLTPHYFQRAALQLLFLQVCGADLETSDGGDPSAASRVLHIGRRIASQWHEGGREFPYEQDVQEREELARGADRAALRIVLRALVEHASASDPDLRARISVAADAYLAELIPQSPMEKRFTELVRGSVSSLIGKASAQRSK